MLNNYVQQEGKDFPLCSNGSCGKTPLKAVVSKFNASIIMDTENGTSYNCIKKAIGQAAIKGAKGIYEQ